jgi:hypothetical protein
MREELPRQMPSSRLEWSGAQGGGDGTGDRTVKSSVKIDLHGVELVGGGGDLKAEWEGEPGRESGSTFGGKLVAWGSESRPRGS